MNASIEPFSKGSRGPFETLVLRDKGSIVELIPARGGLVTRFCVQGREVLYLDEETLFDVGKNVRGGVPVLFPVAGRLAKDTLPTPLGPRTLPQHGFARRLPWELLPRGDGPVATLRLLPDETAREAFPYEGFELRVTYALTGPTLAVTAEVRHHCTTDMPLHLGFHPYFALPPGSKRSAWVVTDATRAFNNRTGVEENFAGWAFGEDEVDLHLLDHGVLRPDGLPGTCAVLSAQGRDLLRLDLDPAFTTVVVWTLPGRDFLCVEPWTGPANAPNTELAKYLHRRETFRARWSITAL